MGLQSPTERLRISLTGQSTIGRNAMKLISKQIKTAVAVSAALALALGVSVFAVPAQANNYKIGVSNSWAGNSWRETMVCAIKAEATLSGKVANVTVLSRNTDAAGQSADIRTLKTQGMNAIIVNSGDPAANNAAIKEATDAGIKVIAVDNAITAPNTTLVANDQVEYGRVGAEALAKAMNYKGNVLYMRGASGAGADTDRDTGFKAEMKKYKNIKITKEVFTNWDWATGGTLANQLLVPGKFQGVWTSGIDYNIVNAMTTKLKGKYIPVVGSDNNEFMKLTQQLAPKGFVGIVVPNPAIIGGYAAKIAIDLLDGKMVPAKNLLAPKALTYAANKKEIDARIVSTQEATFSATLSLPGKTTFTPSQLFRCKAPQDSNDGGR
ncbi:MAG: LacI family transcriptional regulator [Actinobacteria bacterium]|nr:LacI family transcriptional regulator [Actinomycetota bacterium]